MIKPATSGTGPQMLLMPSEALQLTPRMEVKMIDPTTDVTYGFLWVLIICIVATVIMAAGLIWAVLKLRNAPHPTVLIMTLGVITMVVVLTFALTKQNVLATLAGTGLGALAGSLTNVLRPKDLPKDDTEGDK